MPSREAVAFIDRHKDRDRPFFLYLAFNAVHTPMHATDERLNRFASIADKTRRTYAAMTTALDEGVGKVLAKLRAEKLEENTLLVFFSDNGGPTMLGTTINGSRNDPLRGSKRTTLEGGIRVPFALQWKGTLPAGKRYDLPVIQLDLYPTLLAAAGVESDPAWKLDGVNLLPYLGGRELGAPHETLYWRLGQQMALRQGDWKLVRYDRHADPGQGPSAKTGAAQVVGPKLYNLAQDIGESHDLSALYPRETRRTAGRLAEVERPARPAALGPRQRGRSEKCRLTTRPLLRQNTQTVMIGLCYEGHALASPARIRMMSDTQAEDKTIYKVVVNHEEQYSIWPADRKNVAWVDRRGNDRSQGRMPGPYRQGLDRHEAAQPEEADGGGGLSPIPLDSP